MPLARGIVEAFEAIPERIEVSGHAPTWQVTGGSFDAVVDYVREAFDDPVVVARTDRGRWWTRVTLTVTTDPALAAQAPALEDLARPAAPAEPGPPEDTDGVPAGTPGTEPGQDQYPWDDPETAPDPDDRPGTTRARLEDMFAYQDEVRVLRSAQAPFPRQRRP